MRMIGKAMRAVVVEAMGVILVLWLLFGAATWTLNSYASSTVTRRPLIDQSSFHSVREKLRSLQTTALFDRRHDHAPEEVARRLDHYSNLYGTVALDHLKRVVN